MYENGTVDLRRMEKIAFVLSDLMNQGKEIILVSSGAIGVGLAQLGLNARPTTIPEQQAVASIGQVKLMSLYRNFFDHFGYFVGQVLLTKDVVDFPQSRNNAVNTFEQLLGKRVIPIVNENDTVAVDEMDHLTRFGDNDSLSAMVLEMTNADLLVMLSDIDGFYDKNPHKYEGAQRYDTIQEITDQLYSQATEPDSRFGTGGMTTKLKSAEIVLKNNKQMILLNGENPYDIFQAIAGEDVGTLFSNQN